MAYTSFPAPAQPPDVPAEEPAMVPNDEPVALTQMQEIVIEADDNGFYLDGDSLLTLNLPRSARMKLVFEVRSKNVYYGGLDFKGCGQTAGGVKPGGTTSITLTPEQSCTITSYWPASGVIKSTLQINVQ